MSGTAFQEGLTKALRQKPIHICLFLAKVLIITMNLDSTSPKRTMVKGKGMYRLNQLNIATLLSIGGLTGSGF